MPAELGEMRALAFWNRMQSDTCKKSFPGMVGELSEATPMYTGDRVKAWMPRLEGESVLSWRLFHHKPQRAHRKDYESPRKVSFVGQDWGRGAVKLESPETPRLYLPYETKALNCVMGRWREGQKHVTLRAQVKTQDSWRKDAGGTGRTGLGAGLRTAERDTPLVKIPTKGIGLMQQFSTFFLSWHAYTNY